MKKLSDVAQTGDIVFLMENSGFWDKVIQFFSGGPETHVCLVYDDKNVFEQDTEIGHTHFDDITEYDNEHIRIFRVKNLTDQQRKEVKKQCDWQLNIPYSYPAFCIQALFSWLPQKGKDWIDGMFDNYNLSKCDKAVTQVMFPATADEFWVTTSASNPHELLVDLQKFKKADEVRLL